MALARLGCCRLRPAQKQAPRLLPRVGVLTLDRIVQSLLMDSGTGPGVTVNAIAHGYIPTATTRALLDDRERSRATLDRIPRDAGGMPSDLSGVIVFLASPASACVSGVL
jgi:NAD(P)-dependent dehydrogenase (short-subunit alcohol dehydrogenase family)